MPPPQEREPVNYNRFWLPPMKGFVGDAMFDGEAFELQYGVPARKAATNFVNVQNYRGAQEFIKGNVLSEVLLKEETDARSLFESLGLDADKFYSARLQDKPE